jgi:hypothetical protein
VDRSRGAVEAALAAGCRRGTLVDEAHWCVQREPFEMWTFEGLWGTAIVWLRYCVRSAPHWPPQQTAVVSRR